MIQQVVYLAGGVIRCLPALFATLVWLLIVSPVQAAVADSSSQVVSGYTPINLTQTYTRYALASLHHSPGFIAAPDDLTLDRATEFITPELITAGFNTPEFITPDQSAGLTPNFTRHNRYWLYAEVVNHTDTADWVLHVSNFGFEQVKVLLRGSDGQLLSTFQNTGHASGTDINTIGRAIKLKLQPGKPYLLVVELKASNVVWPPYIALMGDSHYQDWKVQMDYAFKLALGIIIGLTLLALICWLFTAESVFFWAGFSSLLMLCYYLGNSSVPAIFWQSSYEKTLLFWGLVSANLLSLLAFSASFLQVNRHSGRWYQIFTGTALFTIVILIVGSLLSFKYKGLLYAFNYIFVWGVILGSGIAKVRTDGRYYLIYILGWLPLVVSILHVILTLFLPQKIDQVITVSYKLIYVQYVQISHMLIHAVALMLRVKTLREDKRQAEYISQAKSRFIAQSSHDLQQPLSSMNIFLDYLQPHVHGMKGKKIFKQLKNTRQQMSDSFNTIMDFSKLEAGAILPEIKTVSIASVLSKIQHEYQILVAAKNLKLNIHSTSLKITSDPVLLERMLRNLVSNAVKYTHSGRVVVGCRRRGRHVIIQVLDTGCGISEADQNHIFDIYQRSALNPKQTEGSGIGLSVVKHLSDLLDHPMNMQSTLGKGSSFSLAVPRAKKLVSNLQEAVKLNNRALVVALALQDDDLRGVVTEHLKKWHCLIQTFRTVDEACQFNKTQVNTTQANAARANKTLSNVAADILLCEYSTLSVASLSSEKISKLTQHYVAACVCAPNTPLPKNWIAMSIPAQPSQLRALLNAATRQRQVNINQTTINRTNIKPGSKRE